MSAVVLFHDLDHLALATNIHDATCDAQDFDHNHKLDRLTDA